MTCRLGFAAQTLSCPLPRRSILTVGLLASLLPRGGRASAETMQELARKVEYGPENGYQSWGCLGFDSIP